MANRYYQQNIAQYNPLSMEEMLFTPTIMRSMHDQLDQGYATTETELGQYNSLTQDQEFAQSAIDPVRQELSQMADSLSKEGFNRNKMSNFRKLRATKEKLFGQDGEVGLAQAKFDQFQTKAAELKEQFKDQPGIANYYINQLMQSPGLTRDELGNITGKDLNQINPVRHYDAKEINDLIDSQLGNIKASLSSLGMENVGSIGSIQDVWKQGTIEGIKAEDIENILKAQISPEVLASAKQYGRVNYGDEEEGVKSLHNQILGAAAGAGYSKVNEKYNIVTNEDLKYNRDQIENIPQFYSNNGSRIEMNAINPFGDIKFNSMTGDIITKPNEGVLSSGDYEYISGTGMSTKKRKDGQLGTSEYDTNVKNFLEFKNNDPVLSKMSNKKAWEHVSNNISNYTQAYGKVNKTALNNTNYVKTILSSSMNSGVYTTNGEMGDLQKIIEDAGYKDYNEFIDKNKGAYQGYRKMGPQGTPVHEFVMSNGESFFVESEDNIKALSQTSTKINTMVLNGELSSDFEPAVMKTDDGYIQTQEVIINPTLSTGEQPYVLNIVPKDDRVDFNDLILSQIKGMPESNVIKLLENNYGLKEGEDFVIENADQVNAQENENINNTLGNKKTGYMNQ